MVDQLKESHSEMTDKMEEINRMIKDLHDQQTLLSNERRSYEEAHGITDGAERMAAAMDEARIRQRIADEERDAKTKLAREAKEQAAQVNDEL